MEVESERINPRTIAICGALLVIAVFAYFPALSGGFVWDDVQNIAQNPNLTTGPGLLKIYAQPDLRIQYYPLCQTTWWIEYQLWGLNTTGYHVVNLLLHLINALLLWRVLKQLELPGAAFAAAAFLLHPVHVESVAWMTERKNTLSGFFYFLALLYWLRFDPLSAPATQTNPAQPPRDNRYSWYIASLGCFIAALLSKTVACSLPAVILLLIWWKRGAIRRGDVIRLAPFFAAGLGLSMFTAWVEQHPVGAEDRLFQTTFVQHILIGGRALWFYACKLLWPYPLTFIYPRWNLDRTALSQWLFPIAAGIVIASLFMFRKRLGRGPLVAVLCFAGTQLPSFGFFAIYFHRFSFVADHWNYLGSIFLLALLAALAAKLLRSPLLRSAAAVCALLVCALLTRSQSSVYASEETVWRDTLAKNPECWLAHNNLGTILLDRKEFAAAIEHYHASLQLCPDGIYALRYLARAYERSGNFSQAAAIQRHLLELVPRAFEPWFRLAAMENSQGHQKEEMEYLALTLKAKDSHLPALIRYAWLLATASDARSRNPAEAVRLADKAVQLGGEQALSVDAQAAARAANGEFDQAAALATRAEELAEEEGKQELAKMIEARIELYKAGKVYVTK